MNANKVLRKAPLPSGVFTIRGEQGVGKTSFAVALLCEDYRCWRKWRSEQGRQLAQKYYADNRIKLRISDRLYFTNIPVLLDKRHNLYTHYIDVQRLGLPNDDYAVQYLPRGSVVFIQEADILLFCRDYRELNNYLINLLKYVRHNLITVIFDCQSDGALDKAVRRLTVGLFHIEDSYSRRFFFFWKPQTWRFLYIKNQLNEVLKDLAEVGVRADFSVVERGKFRYFGKVFKRYNSFSGVSYFLKGIEKVGYEYLPHPSDNMKIETVEQFCALHPLVKPKETLKKKQNGT